MTDAVGKVYLVGAGPGDPGLLTLRGRAVLSGADVVVYDGLVNEELLKHAPEAEKIFVGKKTGQHPLTQEDINRLLVEQARGGASVVRLKGGDPFVFGRGGEEAQALADAGVPFEVVPGVTAGLAGAAYAGIPVTHRGKAGAVTLVTGHGQSEDESDLPALPTDGTLVFYMGLEKIRANMDGLVAAGRGAETPVAVVEWATLPRQRTVTGTIGTIADACADAEMVSPCIVVVGEVVSLRETLAWFESRPLFGKRVAVTRARRRAGELVTLLRERGAEVFEFPTVEIEVEAEHGPDVDVSEFDWVVLTSINGVDTLFERMGTSGRDVRDLKGVKICAISDRTARALEERFLRPELVPERYDTETVIGGMESIGGGSVEGRRFLFPRADIGRSALPKALRERGAEVVELKAYRTEIPKDAAQLAEELVAFAPDYVTFGSAVSARNFCDIVGAEGLAAIVESARFAAIGPIAAEAASELGMATGIVPERHRVPDLVDAIVADAEANAPGD